MTVELMYEDPPHARMPGSPDYEAMAAELRRNPGRWAVIKLAETQQSAATIAYAIRCGRYPAFRPAEQWDTRSRTVDGEFRVYARFSGGEGDDVSRR
ncbi:hypothetical protein [Streptomyces sp. NPDC093261]|uniref:hypothetical protein n=1 Tax=Streptomyces sp. NPDC093261 TaxID=3366037 RepID=UPI00381D6F3E